MPRKDFEAFARLDASDVNTFLMDQSVMTFPTSAARGSAIADPVEGMVTYLEDSNSLQVFDGVSYASAAGMSSGNAIINGGFDIWQRGFTFISPANGAYTADRWSAVFCSAVSRSTDVPAGFQYSAEFSGSASAANLNHRIESSDSVALANQTVTVSLWARSTAGTTALSLEVYTPTSVDNFGSLNGGPTAVLANPPAAGWTRYSATFTVPAAATNGLQLRFIRATGTTTTRITGVQIEVGSVFNDFRRNANSLQGELAACQRYFFRGGPGAQGMAVLSTLADMIITYPVTMRAAPSVSHVTNYGVLEVNVAGRTATALAGFGAGTSASTLSITVGAGGLTPPNRVVITGNTLPLGLDFNAEL